MGHGRGSVKVEAGSSPERGSCREIPTGLDAEASDVEVAGAQQDLAGLDSTSFAAALRRRVDRPRQGFELAQIIFW